MNKARVDYSTTSDDMSALWDAIHSSRINTPTVKVHKETLTRLLIDHNRLVNGRS